MKIGGFYSEAAGGFSVCRAGAFAFLVFGAWLQGGSGPLDSMATIDRATSNGTHNVYAEP
jgi:hypothetical protein